MERARINERTASGRNLAKATLAATGKTHRGKASLGRPAKADADAVKAWRTADKDKIKSISETAKNFKRSETTVKRYCAARPIFRPNSSLVCKIRIRITRPRRDAL